MYTVNMVVHCDFSWHTVMDPILRMVYPRCPTVHGREPRNPDGARPCTPTELPSMAVHCYFGPRTVMFLVCYCAM